MVIHWRRFAACLLSIAIILAACLTALAADPIGLKAPAGFEVSLYADDALAHDIYSLTVDAQGRIVVAGPGYVKILHDDQHVGRANRATLFSKLPASGAQGLYFDGPDLLCTGDGALMRLHDPQGKGQAEGPPEVWAKLRNPEHGVHAIVRGPDGWFYSVCGNDAGLTSQLGTSATSPIHEPRCGGIIRFSPDGQQSEIVADGFRNPYDFDFTAEGHILTVDSDNERDHHLPWYAPTRLLDVQTGREHGWLQMGWQQGWNRPASYFDGAPRIVEIGRGSPTGAVVYRHRAFPAHYRGGLFSACWTLGKVYYFPLQRSGSTYHSQLEVFLETTGDIGFAPVDMAVNPAGDLFVAIGGRQTRGSVFRIHYQGPALEPIVGDELTQVLSADQPLSSWSRARWLPLAKKLGPKVFEAAAVDALRESSQRIRAVEILTDVFAGFSPDVAVRAIALHDPELSARVAWSLSRRPNAASVDALAQLTHDADPRVTRAAWEGVAVLPAFLEHKTTEQDRDFDGNFGYREAVISSDRQVRAAMISAAKARGLRALQFNFNDNSPVLEPKRSLANLWLVQDPKPETWNFDACLADYAGVPDATRKLEAVRLIQIGLGDIKVEGMRPEVFSGYLANSADQLSAENRAKIIEKLSPTFPTADAELNHELARLFAMLAADDNRVAAGVAAQWTSDSSPVDDVNYLIVMARLPGDRTPELTQRTAQVLVGLAGKMAARHMLPSRNWPVRVGEAFDELCRLDPALLAAMAADKNFGLPEHSLFVLRMRGAAQQTAAAKLLEHLQQSPDVTWTSEVVDALRCLPPDKLLPVLREQWDEIGLRDSIALALAEHPDEADRARLVQSLSSVQGNVVSHAAQALTQLKSPGTGKEVRAALQALRQFGAGANQRAVRQNLAQLLEHWSGEKIAVDETGVKEPLSVYRPWFDWFAQAFPEESAKLSSFGGGADMVVWKARLAKVDWSAGDKARGQAVFERKSCHRCHTGAGKLGPDLAGAAARFSRDDLFEAILDPSKDIAPLYQTTAIVTRSGDVYNGLIVYESPDSTLLQTGPDTTVRITGADRASVLPSRVSLMPTGLLNDVADGDLADLYAFLKTLTK